MSTEKYGPDTIPCCEACDVIPDGTKVCTKCAVVYCKHFASSTDVRYCANCISDFTIKETIMEKIVEHERPDGTVTFSRKYQARHITLQGTDWLFAAHKIEEMTDAEIEASIEYHRANVGLMLQERESRKLERFKKLSGIKLVHQKHESQLEREKREAKGSRKKTRTKEKEINTAEAIMKMLQTLAAAGLTAEQIAAMVGGGKR
jgi:hypothetical protein